MSSTDRDALVALLHATGGGATWARKDNWDTDADLSLWYGVEVDDEGRVVTLRLKDNNLRGHIPKELGDLSNLEWLQLENNQLTGPIPPVLGKLTALKCVDLGKNQLTGAIPPVLGNLTKLQHIDLHGNWLSGSIPQELASLMKLETLWLYNNRLTAFWDHMRDIASEDHVQQGCSAEASVPKQLEKLLAWLSVLRKRRGLQLDDNPWKEPPEAVVKKGIRAASKFFTDLYAEGTTIRLNMIKVVLVGQPSAGKTSLRQSMRTRRPTPTSGAEESTVQIDVEEMKMDVDGTPVSLRVYDCAGQVAYTGLLQMFFTPRAVTLLVYNAGAFGEQDGCTSDGDPLERDKRKLRELCVCDWLRSLSFRIPDSDVVVVATKCDLAGGMAAHLAGRMERSIREWLRNWSGSGMPVVRVEDGVSLTSCITSGADKQEDALVGKRKKPGEPIWACDWREDMRDEPPPSLLHRVMYNGAGDLRGSALVLPRSWSIALRVLDALASGRDPVESVRQMELNAKGPKDGRTTIPTTAKQHKGMQSVTMCELSAKWNEIVEALRENGVKVTNPSHALEGALLIRDHEGSLVRHEAYIFLEVTWLVKIFKPLLNHKDREDSFCGSLSLGDTGITLDDFDLISSWKRFKDTGLLELTLADALWPDGLSRHVLPTLESLGLAHPVEGSPAEGLVVLLRLGKERPRSAGKELDQFRREHAAVLSVTWKIFLGVPPGAVEKALMRCCSIGKLRTFWRFGVLVIGSLGAATASKTFALLVEYSQEKTEVDMKIYGDIGTAAPWTALSFGISAFRNMCSEFPGLRWRASLRCPEHDQCMQISSAATRPGDKLLRQNGCSLCTSETGGFGAAATDLLEMVDLVKSKGDIFQETQRRFVDVQRQYPALYSEGSRGFYPEQARLRFDAWLSGMKEEVEALLKGPIGATRGESAEKGYSETEREDFGGKSDEVAKLQRLVGDLQQQLGQHHQDVRGWLGVVDKRLEAIIVADSGAMEKQDFVVTMLKAIRRGGCDTPRLACILPPWKFAKAHGLSESEQAPAGWVARLSEWREDDFKQGKGVFTKKKRLFLVCAQTHRLVPCGPNGQGYDIQQYRAWFRTSCSVATFALHVVCATLAAMAVAPLAGVGAAAEASVSAAMEGFESMLQKQLEALSLDDDRADVTVGDKAPQLEGGAYTALREFIHGVEDTARLEILKGRRDRRGSSQSSDFVFFAQKMVQVQRSNGDAAVQWVLKEHKDAWLGAMRSAPIA